jgi:hypothetical protein
LVIEATGPPRSCKSFRNPSGSDRVPTPGLPCCSSPSRWRTCRRAWSVPPRARARVDGQAHGPHWTIAAGVLAVAVVAGRALLAEASPALCLAVGLRRRRRRGRTGRHESRSKKRTGDPSPQPTRRSRPAGVPASLHVESGYLPFRVATSKCSTLWAHERLAVAADLLLGSMITQRGETLTAAEASRCRARRVRAATPGETHAWIGQG